MVNSINKVETSTFYLRIINLNVPNYITEIELETIKQINWYLKGQFFIGQMPPLSSLVSYFIARLAGYHQEEVFLYAGQPFLEFPIVILRQISATLGTLLIPLSYLTIRNIGHSCFTATFAAIMLVFENGIITQSRYVTPDSYMLFFTALAICFYTRKQMMMTGIMIGCAMSSKWTGLLSIPILLTSILLNTWNQLCNKYNKIKDSIQNLFIQVITITLLPFLIYLTIFQIHFWLIPNRGDHDLILSPHLKHSLVGTETELTQSPIAYGSQIVIRHDGTVGGYLHSHRKSLKGGSKQQEVTLYPYIDVNNLWTVHKTNQLWNSSQPLEYVHNMDSIRLEHVASTRKLHSHNHRPQLSAKRDHSEVTAYGDKLIEDINDYWTLKVLTEENTPSKDTTLSWKSLNQRFRLEHARRCTLISHPVYQEDQQQEVTCMLSAGTHVSSWIVESSYHIQLENQTLVSYEPISFSKKIKQVHELMYKYSTNVYDRLETRPTNTKSHQESSIQLYFQHTGFHIWSQLTGYSSHIVINTWLPMLTLSCTLICLGLVGLTALLSQRQIKFNAVFFGDDFIFFLSGMWIWLIGLRFIPTTDQQRSLSDLLGALYFGIGLLAVTLPTLFIPRFKLIVGTLLIILVTVQFKRLSHLTYGTYWTREACEESGIDLDCLLFPNRYPNNTMTALTFVPLPAGHSQSLEYQPGNEWEVQQEKQRLQQSVFKNQATGTLRYHRVLPTPTMSPEEAAEWGKDITVAALKRRQKEQKKKKKNKKKAAKSALKKEE
ncbi:Dolichyl-phosphate-mannose-protein mannosyltransferase-domain-containing protein [Cokeromyces recurvatus]|uniref:Dolichyl-phosphate-mannose-protein mannosyltransferase-domain-containing protein n=1 Tax=Cokeromyces recurvatus TaxID=90255 RepID=UPI00221EABB1|nr:Dolichyl-phosphate-mannose-protein mannosyltransferase-domain-containing protein [Cokeromyces recurvatus]KAI7902951.1 Dolichyl-phosphate-mannose-protein mannosyltransferase-domain-containing protein [Cokeromyces recurvatus]